MARGPALIYADLTFPIHRLRNTIGRRHITDGDVPAIDLAPLDRDRVVSRRHAEIVHREDGFFITFLDARNGVFVNGERMATCSERRLRDGDSLSFGAVTLTFAGDAGWPDGLHAEWAETGFEASSEVTTAAAGTLTGQLHKAVELDELVLHYQPKVVLATGRLEAVECLLRWKHPLYGLVYPDSFLPLAERTGYIKVITGWVLETALKQCAAWRATGLPIHIAVNVSIRDLDDDLLARRVAALLDETALDPADVIIEVTETGVMTNLSHSIRNLEILKSTRVKISIDDFGIGQSSLAYLRQLRADELKIDKSFSLTLDANNLAILRSAINVGHDLGMRVIAEGIESESTATALRQLGCDVGQGYFFGRPESAETLVSSPLALAVIGPPAQLAASVK